MKIRVLTIAALALATAACGTSRTANQMAEPAITEQAYRGYIAALASDAFEGRAPSSEGEKRTVEYLEQQFVDLGLQPANGGSFRQDVPMVRITARPGTTHLSFDGTGKHLELASHDDMEIVTRHVVGQVNVKDSPVVFVGYGIVAPEYGWNDYAGVDMHGKTALILVNDPGFATGDPKLFHGRTMTYYGRWTYKYEEAARQGAAAAIIIHETAPAAYPWSVVQNGWSGPQFYADTPDGNAGRAAIEGWITLDRARQVLALAGQDLGKLQQAAAQRGFRPVPLDITAAAGLSNDIRHTSSPNVVAMLPGKQSPGECVIYMAHWDHFGMAPTGEGDRIFNGAQDNATGVAGILTIARAYRAMLTLPARTVLFVATTGEEAGLIGAGYLANHPLCPLAKTAALINLDLLNPLGRARDVQVIGFGASQLEDRLAAAAARHGRRLTPDATPEAGYFYRADQLPFARKGVPSLYIKSGTDLIGKPPGTGQAMVDDYYAHTYHKQADNYDPSWDVSGSIEDLKLLFEVGEGIADDGSWPNWYPGNEFRAARDASKASRQ